MVLKCCFPLKHHKTNQISSIGQIAVKISKSRKNVLSPRDKTISKTNSEGIETVVSHTYVILANIANGSEMMSFGKRR